MPDVAATDERRFLDPRVLARVKGVELRARHVVEGLMSGRHRSPLQGSSVEFAQHRPYVQGDDTRHIDWKVFGRTDKLHIKQFQEETQLQVVLAVDASESMSFGSVRGAGGELWTKFDHATTLAATLAYLATAQTDAVGAAIFSDGLARYLKPSAAPGQWRTIAAELQATQRWRPTSLGRSLEQLAGKVSGRSLAIVLTDGFDDPDALERGLRALRFRRHDVVVLQLLDPQEIGFPFEDVTLFKGMEQSGDLLTEPRALRAGYLRELAAHNEQIARACRRVGGDFQPFDTGQPLDAPLHAFFAGRRSTRGR